MSFLPEIQQIEQRISTLGSAMRSEVLAYSEASSASGELRFPIYKLSFCSTAPQAPVLEFVGGVPGLERIGAQVTVALLNSFSELVSWDKNLQNALQDIRVFFIPTVNSVRSYRKTRCNPRGIDIC